MSRFQSHNESVPVTYCKSYLNDSKEGFSIPSARSASLRSGSLHQGFYMLVKALEGEISRRILASESFFKAPCSF